MDQNLGTSDLNELQRQKTFRDLLDKGRKEKKFTDVQLKIGDNLFDAHRNVLSLYSPVLEAAISDQWSKEGICEIGDEYVDVEIVENLLSFLYTGEIDLTPDNVHPLCIAAHFLQIFPLLDVTGEYLSKEISAENVFTLFKFSIDRQMELLRNSCSKFIAIHHEKLLENSQILELSFDNFKGLIEGLKDQTSDSVLRVNTFDCIARWTEKNLLERPDDLSILLENIPLEELPHEFLTETISTHKSVIESISCAKALIKALSSFQVVSNSPSKMKQELVVIRFASFDKNYNYRTRAMRYSSETEIWEALPNLIQNRSFFAATAFNQQNIIACGGNITSDTSSDTINCVEIFNCSAKIWTKLPKMPERLGKLSMATAYNGLLYVSGGCIDRGTPRSQVLRYSFHEREWKSANSMIVAREHGYLIPFKNHLYAIGGGRDTMERYDPATDKWTMMANMENQYYRFGATLHKDKIYVCGANGFDVYDPEVNVWSSLPVPVLGFGTCLVSMNGKLLAVGGCLVTTNEASDLIYEFDFLTQKWIEFGRMEEPSEYHCAVVVQYN